MSDHYIEICSCGTILAQCRCPDPNKKRIIRYAACSTCRANANGNACSANSDITKPPAAVRIAELEAEIVILKAKLEEAEKLAERAMVAPVSVVPYPVPTNTPPMPGFPYDPCPPGTTGRPMPRPAEFFCEGKPSVEL